MQAPILLLCTLTWLRPLAHTICSHIHVPLLPTLLHTKVTALVKGHGDVTLAIGDGANDVGMIQKAHIGK